jgi:hypothetical protein
MKLHFALRGMDSVSKPAGKLRPYAVLGTSVAGILMRSLLSEVGIENAITRLPYLHSLEQLSEQNLSGRLNGPKRKMKIG